MRKLTKLEFVQRANEIYNKKYDYSKVIYKNTDTKVTIICIEHNIEFEQSPKGHYLYEGCYKCKGKDTASKSQSDRMGTRPDKTQHFIEKAKKIHNNFYDYSKVKYVKSTEKVIIICKKHNNEFEQTPKSHYRGRGCPECGLEKNLEYHRISKEEFVEKAIKVHGKKFDYSESEYVNNQIKIKIICNKGHVFYQKPLNHTIKKHGCPKCQCCPNCELFTTNKRLCEYCKPVKENKLYRKTKEMAVVNFLKEQLPDQEFIHNKSVGSECTGGHLFPDIRFDCNYFYLIIEVDEYKHRASSYNCEEKRMIDIIANLGMPCVFIRYNPDSKKSDAKILLKSVNKYLKYQEVDSDDTSVYKKIDLDEKTSMKVNYLFY